MNDLTLNTLGCTGGIGSGKSYVCTIFEKLGYQVYNSDNRAKLLYDTDQILLENIIQLLGSDIIKNGKLDKKLMANKIFSNKDLLIKVENLVHPAVLRDFCNWKRAIENNGKKTDCSFVIFESAILLEKPEVKSIADKILNISAPDELRIERVIKRDNITREQVLQRLSKQWSNEQREKMSDFIIFANSKTALLPQVLKVIEQMNNFNIK